MDNFEDYDDSMTQSRYDTSSEGILLTDYEYDPIDVPGKIPRTRKVLGKWDADQSLQLIMEVKSRQVLWNPSSTDYKDRKVRAAHWQEVSSVLGRSFTEVRNKWNSIRNSFRMAYNKANITKNGPRPGADLLFNSLKFLEPTLNKISSGAKSLTSEIVTSDEPINFPAAKVRRLKSVPVEISNQETDPLSTDAWDKIGNFVTMNGRRWAASNPLLEAKFRASLYKLVSDIETEAVEDLYKNLK